MKIGAHPAVAHGSIGWHPYLLGWAALLILNLLTTPAADPLPALGSIRRTNSITWDDPNVPTSKFWVSGYEVWVGSTNDVILNGPSALAKLGEVQTNLWTGTNMYLNGSYAMAVTCIGNYISSNLVGTNFVVATNRITSDFSPIYSVQFLQGIPVPADNFQLFTVMQVMATNSLPALAPASPVPISAAMAPSLTGPEYELSGR